MNLFDVAEEPVNFLCRQLEICSAWRSDPKESNGGSWTDGARHVMVAVGEIAGATAGTAISAVSTETSTATSTVTATATATATVSATASEIDVLGSCPVGHASVIHRVEFPVDNLVSELAVRRLPLLLKYVRKNLLILSTVSQELLAARVVVEESFPEFRCFFDPSILLVDQQRDVNELAKQHETGEGVDESTGVMES